MASKEQTSIACVECSVEGANAIPPFLESIFRRKFVRLNYAETKFHAFKCVGSLTSYEPIEVFLSIGRNDVELEFVTIYLADTTNYSEAPAPISETISQRLFQSEKTIKLDNGKLIVDGKTWNVADITWEITTKSGLVKFFQSNKRLIDSFKPIVYDWKYYLNAHSTYAKSSASSSSSSSSASSSASYAKSSASSSSSSSSASSSASSSSVHSNPDSVFDSSKVVAIEEIRVTEVYNLVSIDNLLLMKLSWAGRYGPCCANDFIRIPLSGSQGSKPFANNENNVLIENIPSCRSLVHSKLSCKAQTNSSKDLGTVEVSIPCYFSLPTCTRVVIPPPKLHGLNSCFKPGFTLTKIAKDTVPQQRNQILICIDRFSVFIKGKQSDNKLHAQIENGAASFPMKAMKGNHVPAAGGKQAFMDWSWKDLQATFVTNQDTLDSGKFALCFVIFRDGKALKSYSAVFTGDAIKAGFIKHKFHFLIGMKLWIKFRVGQLAGADVLNISAPSCLFTRHLRVVNKRLHAELIQNTQAALNHMYRERIVYIPFDGEFTCSAIDESVKIDEERQIRLSKYLVDLQCKIGSIDRIIQKCIARKLEFYAYNDIQSGGRWSDMPIAKLKKILAYLEGTAYSPAVGKCYLLSIQTMVDLWNYANLNIKNRVADPANELDSRYLGSNETYRGNIRDIFKAEFVEPKWVEFIKEFLHTQEIKFTLDAFRTCDPVFSAGMIANLFIAEFVSACIQVEKRITTDSCFRLLFWDFYLGSLLHCPLPYEGKFFNNIMDIHMLQVHQTAVRSLKQDCQHWVPHNGGQRDLELISRCQRVILDIRKFSLAEFNARMRRLECLCDERADIIAVVNSASVELCQPVIHTPDQTLAVTSDREYKDILYLTERVPDRMCLVVFDENCIAELLGGGAISCSFKLVEDNFYELYYGSEGRSNLYNQVTGQYHRSMTRAVHPQIHHEFYFCPVIHSLLDIEIKDCQDTVIEALRSWEGDMAVTAKLKPYILDLKAVEKYDDICDLAKTGLNTISTMVEEIFATNAIENELIRFKLSESLKKNEQYFAMRTKVKILETLEPLRDALRPANTSSSQEETCWSLIRGCARDLFGKLEALKISDCNCGSHGLSYVAKIALLCELFSDVTNRPQGYRPQMSSNDSLEEHGRSLMDIFARASYYFVNRFLFSEFEGAATIKFDPVGLCVLNQLGAINAMWDSKAIEEELGIQNCRKDWKQSHENVMKKLSNSLTEAKALLDQVSETLTAIASLLSRSAGLESLDEIVALAKANGGTLLAVEQIISYVSASSTASQADLAKIRAYFTVVTGEVHKISQTACQSKEAFALLLLTLSYLKKNALVTDLLDKYCKENIIFDPSNNYSSEEIRKLAESISFVVFANDTFATVAASDESLVVMKGRIKQKADAVIRCEVDLLACLTDMIARGNANPFDRDVMIGCRALGEALIPLCPKQSSESARNSINNAKWKLGELFDAVVREHTENNAELHKEVTFSRVLTIAVTFDYLDLLDWHGLTGRDASIKESIEVRLRESLLVAADNFVQGEYAAISKLFDTDFEVSAWSRIAHCCTESHRAMQLFQQRRSHFPSATGRGFLQVHNSIDATTKVLENLRKIYLSQVSKAIDSLTNALHAAVLTIDELNSWLVRLKALILLGRAFPVAENVLLALETQFTAVQQMLESTRDRILADALNYIRTKQFDAMRQYLITPSNAGNVEAIRNAILVRVVELNDEIKANCSTCEITRMQVESYEQFIQDTEQKPFVWRQFEVLLENGSELAMWVALLDKSHLDRINDGININWLDASLTSIVDWVSLYLNDKQYDKVAFLRLQLNCIAEKLEQASDRSSKLFNDLRKRWLEIISNQSEPVDRAVAEVLTKLKDCLAAFAQNEYKLEIFESLVLTEKLSQSSMLCLLYLFSHRVDWCTNVSAIVSQTVERIKAVTADQHHSVSVSRLLAKLQGLLPEHFHEVIALRSGIRNHLLSLVPIVTLISNNIVSKISGLTDSFHAVEEWISRKEYFHAAMPASASSSSSSSASSSATALFVKFDKSAPSEVVMAAVRELDDLRTQPYWGTYFDTLPETKGSVQSSISSLMNAILSELKELPTSQITIDHVFFGYLSPLVLKLREFVATDNSVWPLLEEWRDCMKKIKIPFELIYSSRYHSSLFGLLNNINTCDKRKLLATDVQRDMSQINNVLSELLQITGVYFTKPTDFPLSAFLVQWKISVNKWKGTLLEFCSKGPTEVDLRKSFRSWIALYCVTLLDNDSKLITCLDSNAINGNIISALLQDCLTKAEHEVRKQSECTHLFTWFQQPTDPNPDYAETFAALQKMQMVATSMTEQNPYVVIKDPELASQFLKAVSFLEGERKRKIQTEIILVYFQQLVPLVNDLTSNPTAEANERVILAASRCLVELTYLSNIYLNADEFGNLVKHEMSKILSRIGAIPSIGGAVLRGMYEQLLQNSEMMRFGVGATIVYSEDYEQTFKQFTQSWRNEKFLLKREKLLELTLSTVDLTASSAVGDSNENIFARNRVKFGDKLEYFFRVFTGLCKDGRRDPYRIRSRLVTECRLLVIIFALSQSGAIAANPQLRELLRRKEDAADKNFFLRHLSFNPFVEHVDEAGRLVDLIATEQFTASNVGFELMIRIFALWSLLYSGKGALDDAGNANLRDLRPHEGQVLALLILFEDLEVTMPNTEQKFHPIKVKTTNQFIQIGTGQGKSITLAVASLVFALFGMSVDCICYSEYLSCRDYEHFEELFRMFRVREYINYNAYDKQSKAYVRQMSNNLGCDVEHAVSDLFENNAFPVDQYVQEQIYRGFFKRFFKIFDIRRFVKEMFHSKIRCRALLLDEVDKFLSLDFVNLQFHIDFPLPYRDSIANLFVFLWSNKDNKMLQTLSAIQAQPEYQSCVTAYEFEGWRQIFPEAVAAMLVARDEVNNKAQPSRNNNVARYSSAFAYLKERDCGSAAVDPQPSCLRIILSSGKFSPPEVAKLYLESGCVIGVTGTLNTMAAAQIKAAKDNYNIEKFTIIPSAFLEERAPKLQYLNGATCSLPSRRAIGQTGGCVIVLKDDLFREIFDNLLRNIVQLRRAGLIFFEDVDILQGFEDYLRSKAKENREFDKITVNTMKPGDSHAIRTAMVRAACHPGQITLCSRDYGRGVDFIVHSQELIRNGGMHVIQTFPSLERSEEVQIQGRTCRQDNPGSYCLIVAMESVKDMLNVSIEQQIFGCKDKETDSIIYDRLDKLRRQKFDESYISAIGSTSMSIVDEHEQSMKLITAIVNRNANQVSKLLLDSNRCCHTQGYRSVASPTAVLMAGIGAGVGAESADSQQAVGGSAQFPAVRDRPSFGPSDEAYKRNRVSSSLVILVDGQYEEVVCATRRVFSDHSRSKLAQVLRAHKIDSGRVRVKLIAYRNYLLGPSQVLHSSEWLDLVQPDEPQQQLEQRQRYHSKEVPFDAFYEEYLKVITGNQQKCTAIDLALQSLNKVIRRNALVSQVVVLGSLLPYSSKADIMKDQHPRAALQDGIGEAVGSEFDDAVSSNSGERIHISDLQTRRPTVWDTFLTSRLSYELQQLRQCKVPVHTVLVPLPGQEHRQTQQQQQFIDDLRDLTQWSGGLDDEVPADTAVGPSEGRIAVIEQILRDAIINDICRDTDDQYFVQLRESLRDVFN